VSNIADVLSIYRDRLRDLKQDSRLAHALIFKNQGALAGASVHHSHSQLIATPFVPIAIEDELAAADDFLHKEGHNLFEAIVQQELADEHRLILQTDHYVAFCPYASRFAYESWIVPRRSGSHFESSGDADLQELAPVLKSVLNRLDQNLKNPALNYVLHSAPLHQPDLPYYRWHLKILPRLTRVAGFEWGSGCYINEVLPEHAARQLREPAV
jgi:UDPglucose--hexose-1-phosphate uridylyltransferase